MVLGQCLRHNLAIILTVAPPYEQVLQYKIKEFCLIVSYEKISEYFLIVLY